MGTSGLGTLLVEDGLLSQADHRTIVANCGGDGAAYAKGVLAVGLLDEGELAAFIAERTRYQVADKEFVQTIDPAVISLVDSPILARLDALPLEISGQQITVAMADPLDQATVNQLEFFTGLRVRPIIAPLSQIRAALARVLQQYVPRPSPLESFLENHALGAGRRLQAIHRWAEPVTKEGASDDSARASVADHSEDAAPPSLNTAGSDDFGDADLGDLGDLDEIGDLSDDDLVMDTGDDDPDGLADSDLGMVAAEDDGDDLEMVDESPSAAPAETIEDFNDVANDGDDLVEAAAKLAPESSADDVDLAGIDDAIESSGEGADLNDLDAALSDSTAGDVAELSDEATEEPEAVLIDNSVPDTAPGAALDDLDAVLGGAPAATASAEPDPALEVASAAADEPSIEDFGLDESALSDEPSSESANDSTETMDVGSAEALLDDIATEITPDASLESEAAPEELATDSATDDLLGDVADEIAGLDEIGEEADVATVAEADSAGDLTTDLDADIGGLEDFDEPAASTDQVDGLLDDIDAMSDADLASDTDGENAELDATELLDDLDEAPAADDLLATENTDDESAAIEAFDESDLAAAEATAAEPAAAEPAAAETVAAPLSSSDAQALKQAISIFNRASLRLMLTSSRDDAAELIASTLREAGCQYGWAFHVHDDATTTIVAWDPDPNKDAVSQFELPSEAAGLAKALARQNPVWSPLDENMRDQERELFAGVKNDAVLYGTGLPSSSGGKLVLIAGWDADQHDSVRTAALDMVQRLSHRC